MNAVDVANVVKAGSEAPSEHTATPTALPQQPISSYATRFSVTRGRCFRRA
jgi:hypothetical protein